MAAISLIWDTNMAAVTSCENTLYVNSSTLKLEKRDNLPGPVSVFGDNYFFLTEVIFC